MESARRIRALVLAEESTVDLGSFLNWRKLIVPCL
jgi:hypothetical protein